MVQCRGNWPDPSKRNTKHLYNICTTSAQRLLLCVCWDFRPRCFVPGDTSHIQLSIDKVTGGGVGLDITVGIVSTGPETGGQ